VLTPDRNGRDGTTRSLNTSLNREPVLTPLPTLSAYRADLDRYPDRARVAECDGVWIVVARAVEQFLEVDAAVRSTMSRELGDNLVSSAIVGTSTSPPHRRERVVALASALRDDRDATGTAEVFDGGVRVAEDMEGAGALHLAFTMLAHLRAGCPGIDARRHGLALSMQGRIAREMGDLDSAVELYQEAFAMAAEQHDDHTLSLVAHGLGGIALARGNLPAARAQYQAALGHARSAGAIDLEGRAHRGLLVVEAKAGDFDAALRHGWAAYERSPGDRNSQAELLGNLAGLARECGHYAASFAGYSLAALWADMDRVRIPALGGAALAAGLEGKAHRLRSLAARVKKDVTAAQPFELAQVLLDLARAFDAIGDDAASDFAVRAEAISTNHRFFELEHEARELQKRVDRNARNLTRAPLELSTPAFRVLDSITALAAQTSSISALVGSTE